MVGGRGTELGAGLGFEAYEELAIGALAVVQPELFRGSVRVSVRGRG